jgi:putative transposase
VSAFTSPNAGNRFEALDPICPGVRKHVGFSANLADGLKLTHDQGSGDTSDDFQVEIRILRMESSPALVRQPEGNGCVERFFRTLKEQLL